jgi:hypothetical protein
MVCVLVTWLRQKPLSVALDDQALHIARRLPWSLAITMAAPA